MERISRFVWILGAAHIGTGLAVLIEWMTRTGGPASLTVFRSVDASFLFAYALAELLFCLLCRGLFGPGDALRRAWSFISWAAACRVAGVLVAGFPPLFRPADAGRDAWLARAGSVMCGPLTLVLLGIGLFVVLRLYARVGLLKRPAAADWIPLTLVAFFLGSQLVELIWRMATPQQTGRLLAWLNWVVDPLLALLLLEAVLLRRAVVNAGGGLIARCWGAYAAAILLLVLASAGSWTIDLGLLASAHAHTIQFAFSLSALAFALAPAYQIEAIVRATRAGVLEF